MPYLAPEHRVWIEKPLDDLLDWVGWNLHLMSTREDTLYHIVCRLLRAFYGIDDGKPIPPTDSEKRDIIDRKLNVLIDTIRKTPILSEKVNGTLNYTLCRVLIALYPKEHSRYADYNNSVGVLEAAQRETEIRPELRYQAFGMMRCVVEEWYRRRIGRYEDEARDLNGEVFE